MISQAIYVSRRGAAVATYLRSPFVDQFRRAVAGREAVEDIPQPYQSWFDDITNIPTEARARYRSAQTGELVVREITHNI